MDRRGVRIARLMGGASYPKPANVTSKLNFVRREPHPESQAKEE